MPSGHKESVSNVEKAYWMLKELLIVYRFKPGRRINESELARQLSVCRTVLDAAAMESHISRRLDEIIGDIKEGFLRIYLVEHAAE